LSDKFVVPANLKKIADKQAQHAIDLYRKCMNKKDKVAYQELIMLYYHYEKAGEVDIADEVLEFCVTATEYFSSEGLPFDRKFLRSTQNTSVNTIRKDSIYEIDLQGRRLCVMRLPTRKEKRFSLSAILSYIKGEGGAGTDYSSKEDSTWIVIDSENVMPAKTTQQNELAKILENLVPSGNPIRASDISSVRIAKPVTKAPLPYQTGALVQLFEHWKKSTGKSSLTLKELDEMLALGPSLRDGHNPIFEPLSVQSALLGLYQLVDDEVISIDGDNINLN
jgi:hypothetical protein